MTDEEKELKDLRIPIMMSAKEVEAIDDWMFAKRIRSRGEAIRRLCQIGVAADEHFVEMLEAFLDVSNAAFDVASQTDDDKQAMDVLAGVMEFWQRFGRLRSVILPMRRGETIEAAFDEMKEINEAWENQDPDGAKKLMLAWLKVARRRADQEK